MLHQFQPSENYWKAVETGAGAWRPEWSVGARLLFADGPPCSPWLLVGTTFQGDLTPAACWHSCLLLSSLHSLPTGASVSATSSSLGPVFSHVDLTQSFLLSPVLFASRLIKLAL